MHFISIHKFHNTVAFALNSLFSFCTCRIVRVVHVKVSGCVGCLPWAPEICHTVLRFRCTAQSVAFMWGLGWELVSSGPHRKHWIPRAISPVLSPPSFYRTYSVIYTHSLVLTVKALARLGEICTPTLPGACAPSDSTAKSGTAVPLALDT